MTERGVRAGERLDACHAASDGTLEERHYICQNRRHDVVAIVTSTSMQVEHVRYSAYGVPFNLPAGDTDSDGDADGADSTQISNWIGVGYDVRGDLNLDGQITSADAAAFATRSGGRGVLSHADHDHRVGYGGYWWDPHVSRYHVRHRAYAPELGRWLTRDPLGYVDGLNLYEYVGGSPIEYIDPWGLQKIVYPWRDQKDRVPGLHPRQPGESLTDFVRRQQKWIQQDYTPHLRGSEEDMDCRFSCADGAQNWSSGSFSHDYDRMRRGAATGGKLVIVYYSTVPACCTGGVGLSPRIGPSGEWKIHVLRFPTRKRAMDAARSASARGQCPMEHAGHFHAVDRWGKKIPGTHYEYPR